MCTEKPMWASLMVYFDQWLFKEPSHVIYITHIWKRWLLEHFYGLRFWPIFDFSWNNTKIHLLTIGILIYTFLSLIRHVFIIIMPFYGIFVTFQNLDFWALFWPYWKRYEPNIAFDDAKRSREIFPKIHKVIRGCWCRITCP